MRRLIGDLAMTAGVLAVAAAFLVVLAYVLYIGYGIVGSFTRS